MTFKSTRQQQYRNTEPLGEIWARLGFYEWRYDNIRRNKINIYNYGVMETILVIQILSLNPQECFH